MKTLNTVFTGALILILIFSAFSQTRPGALQGTVTDAESGESVPFANIIIKQNGQAIAGGATDFDGNFHIKPVKAGTYEITASFIGYSNKSAKKVMIIPNTSTQLDFKLEESIVTLSEVVISYAPSCFATSCRTSCYTTTCCFGSIECYAKSQAISDSVSGEPLDWSVFPNPTRGPITAASSQKMDELLVIDVQGKILFQKVVREKNEVLDLSKLPDGIYFVKFRWGAKWETEGVVKF